MKPKLPCCEFKEIHIMSPNSKTFECDQCECVFGKKERLDDHNREIHEVRFTGKRKFECCDQNAKKRKTDKYQHHHFCQFCDCTFRKKKDLQSHTRSVHVCSKCNQLMLTDDIRAHHKIKHDEEKRQSDEREEMQKQKDDDLIVNYVKTNRLDEYQPEPDYEPDYDYILSNYRLDKVELLALRKKFPNSDLFVCAAATAEEIFTFDQIPYLLENGGCTVEEVTDFLGGLTGSLGGHEIAAELVSYFLDKDYEIKRGWVAKLIEHDALIERIKQKHSFTFDEIYKTEERQLKDNLDDCGSSSSNADEFYVQVHKHFPNPNFKDPFADPYTDFERVSTEHVRDHLQNRYFYDEEDDELSVVVGHYDNEREISLGSCKELQEMNLSDLITQYNKAVQQYDEANGRVSELFDKRNEDLTDDLTENQKLSILDDYYHLIEKDALPERNHYANNVSKLYFVISMK